MQMKHTIFAVISPSRERVADWDTRDQAEADATRRGEGFEVFLLDRRPPKPVPAGIECFLVGASEAERERCLSIYR